MRPLTTNPFSQFRLEKSIIPDSKSLDVTITILLKKTIKYVNNKFTTKNKYFMWIFRNKYLWQTCLVHFVLNVPKVNL